MHNSVEMAFGIATCGSRPGVWDDRDGGVSPGLANSSRNGKDQAALAVLQLLRKSSLQRERDTARLTVSSRRVGGVVWRFREEDPPRQPAGVKFRAEVFDALNRVNFNNPSTTVTDAAFGTISVAKTPREFQFSLSVHF
jgi:hypothetical protein